MRLKTVGFLACLVAMMALLTVPIARAQTTVGYGEAVLGKIEAGVPFAFFNFFGNQDDLASLRLISFDSDFQPTLSVTAPTGQQIAFSNGDPSAFGNHARVDMVLPQAGAYSVQVGGLNGTEGQFILRLDGLRTLNTIPLISGAEAVPVGFFDQPQQILRVPGLPFDSQTISFTGGEASYSASIHSPSGSLIGTVAAAGGSSSFPLPSADGDFIIVLTSPNATTDPVFVGLGASGATTASPSPQTGQTGQTGQTAPTGPIDPNVCTVFAPTQVNLRGGPGTSYDVVGSISAGSSYAATGQNGGWYTIIYQGQTVWVAASVTNVSGPCGNVPFVEAPAVTGQTGPTATSTATPTVGPSPTATATVEGQQAPPPTSTATPTQEAAAFPDNPTQLSWNLQRDTAGNQPQSFAQTIPSPGWHQISVRVDGLSNQGGPNARREFAFTVTCTGTNLRWGTAGRNAAPTRGCNETVNRSFTADSNNFTIYIRVESGAPVSYNILAIRLN